MGYYTTFFFHARNFDTMCPLLQNEIVSLLNELDDTYKLYLFGEQTFELKWYDHNENMIEFSKRYPDILFELEGEGEDAKDNWKAYYHNGKSQICRAKIVYDEPDINKLK